MSKSAGGRKGIVKIDDSLPGVKKLIASALEGVFVPPKGFLAGGCFKDLLIGRKPKDYDVFFRTYEDFVEAVAQCKADCNLLYETPRSVAYENGSTVIELVCYDFGEPEKILEDFDFTVCQMAYDRGELICSERFFEDLAARRLVIVSVPSPTRTFSRMVRYCGYGFQPTLYTSREIGEMLIAIKPGTEVNWEADYDL